MNAAPLLINGIKTEKDVESISTFTATHRSCADACSALRRTSVSENGFDRMADNPSVAVLVLDFDR